MFTGVNHRWLWGQDAILICSCPAAFLVGGYLNPDTFAGGHLRLSIDAARQALRPLADRLQRDEAQTVEAVIQVAASAIYAELSNLAAKQGVSVRDYALLPFGGAGPLLAAAVAEELGISRILVPAAPGTLCSLGALLSDVSKPFVRSIVLPLADAAEPLAAAYHELGEEAAAWLASDAPHLATQRVEVVADMRYLGQSYEIDVTVAPRWLEDGALAAIADAFHKRHRAMFAHADEMAPVEIVDLRLTIVGVTDKPAVHNVVDQAKGVLAPHSTRPVVIRGCFCPVPTFLRRDIPTEARFDGPAIVEQDDTTIYVAPGWTASAHPSGTLILERIPQ